MSSAQTVNAFTIFRMQCKSHKRGWVGFPNIIIMDFLQQKSSAWTWKCLPSFTNPNACEYLLVTSIISTLLCKNPSVQFIHTVFREYLYSSGSPTIYSRACYLGDRRKGQSQRDAQRERERDLAGPTRPCKDLCILKMCINMHDMLFLLSFFSVVWCSDFHRY